jgi:hypothetical protein
MRIWTTALFALAFASEAAAAGAYASHAARDSQACARLCADDGLCIAWSYTAEGACQLRANAPEAPSGVASGFSTRATGQIRQAFVNHTPNPPAAAPFAEPAPDSVTATIADDSANDELLGGPEQADATPSLRLGLHN